MNDNFTHFVDLAKEVEPPDDGILTRTLFNDDNAHFFETISVSATSLRS